MQAPLSLVLALFVIHALLREAVSVRNCGNTTEGTSS